MKIILLNSSLEPWSQDVIEDGLPHTSQLFSFFVVVFILLLVLFQVVLHLLDLFELNFKSLLYKYHTLVLILTPAGNLLERLRKKNGNFKTPSTHGLRHFELKPKIKIKFYQKRLKYYDFRFMKKFPKNSLGRPSKNIAKKYKKNMKLSGFFSNF